MPFALNSGVFCSILINMGNKIAALILAGGKGTRLKALTRKIAKPAVSYGGKYRIIDFPLSNCANSGIRYVGVATQYESSALNSYIGNGQNWGINGVESLCSVLSPKQTEEGSNWYKGTADAVYQNLDWLEGVGPDYVLILSGDHIYSCTYNEMLAEVEKSGADCAIMVQEVPWEEAPRFGILTANEKNEVVEFKEKPKEPKSNLASMGIYIFNYRTLRSALITDSKVANSSHDFGKDIIPNLLSQGKKIIVYRYNGYWRDVGTIDSLHAANMDLLLSGDPSINLYSVIQNNRIYSEDNHARPQYIAKGAKVKDSLINQGAQIYGEVDHCVISSDVIVDEGSLVKNSVLMNGVHVGLGCKVYDAVVGPYSTIEDEEIVNESQEGIALIANGRKSDMK